MKRVMLALLLCVSSCATTPSGECFEALHFFGDDPQGKLTAKRACGDFKKAYPDDDVKVNILVWWLDRWDNQYLCQKVEVNACYEHRGSGSFLIEIRTPYDKGQIWEREVFYHEVMHTLLVQVDTQLSHHRIMYRRGLCPAGHCGLRLGDYGGFGTDNYFP